MSVTAFSPHDSVNDITVLLQEDQCMDQETNHPYERFSYIIATVHHNGGCSLDSDEVTVGTDFTYMPTPSPTKRPTVTPTRVPVAVVENPTTIPTAEPTKEEELGGVSEGAQALQGTSLYLLVFLPLCFIILLAVVGYVSRDYVLGAVCVNDESSEHGLLGVSSGSSGSGVEV